MRTSGGLLAGWADPADVFERVAGAEDDAVLLEATDGTGVSILGLGGRVVHELPDVPLTGGDRTTFEGGWIGWITYEGEARFLEVEQGLVFDHSGREVRVLGVDAGWRDEAADALTHEPRTPSQRPARRTSAPVWRHGDRRYLEMVHACQDAIVRGDAYVLCLTNTA